MQYIVGSAIEIFCEIPVDKITGTDLTLDSIKGPDAVELSTSQTLSQSTATNLFSVIWQSEEGTHSPGKYTYIVKSKNGTIENFSKGNFYLIQRDA